MRIRNVRHKGLRRLIRDGDTRGFRRDVAQKLLDMATFLRNMRDEDELFAVPYWRAHRLAGDRAGAWSLRATANWRITFRIDRGADEIVDLDYEDYH